MFDLPALTNAQQISVCVLQHAKWLVCLRVCGHFPLEILMKAFINCATLTNFAVLSVMASKAAPFVHLAKYFLCS